MRDVGNTSVSRLNSLEDRSRQNNLKLRGVPELVQAADIKKFTTDLFMVLLPETSPIELTIDHIHWVPKPPYLPNTIPRNIIMRIHFYHIKEQILHKARTMGNLQNPYNNIHIFANLITL